MVFCLFGWVGWSGLDYLPSWSRLEEGYVADAVEAVL